MTSAPRRNFRTYAQMESANVALVPGLAFWLGEPRQPLEIAAFVLSAIAAGGLLVIGARYWFAVDAVLRKHDRAALRSAMGFAHRAQVPALLVTVAASLLTFISLVLLGWTSGVIAAAFLAALAALEYVNYYHRQLQHFDNFGDFKRLLTGRGMRRSHMSRHLAEFRRG